MVEEDVVDWTSGDTTVRVGRTRLGDGPPALLLPALSSISTRREMEPLQARLAGRFDTLAVDWPGFGERPRPRMDWTPDMMDAFLDFVLTDIRPKPALLVAAGHAAGYVLRHAARNPAPADRIVLVAPTWRGPFPTMMQGERPWFSPIRKLVDAPGIGPLVYGLNVNRVSLRRMGAGHVYADKGWLEGDRLKEKLAVTRAKGARHGSARFVTGALDPFASRDTFLAAARACAAPILLVYGRDTPPRSKAEMRSLGQVEGVEVEELASGKLSLHEEFPDLVADAILRRSPSPAKLTVM